MNTFLKYLQNNYLDILPIPAPQSKIELKFNCGNYVFNEFKNYSDPLISI